MGMSEKIRIALIKRNMTLKDLSLVIGDKSSTNLSNKLKRDNFNEKELVQIADALNCDFEAHFIMRDTCEKI